MERVRRRAGASARASASRAIHLAECLGATHPDTLVSHGNVALAEQMLRRGVLFGTRAPVGMLQTVM